MLTLIKKPVPNRDDKMIDVKNVLGENIRKLLKEKGLTQQELAERAGISRVYLSDLIRGKKGKRVSQET